MLILFFVLLASISVANESTSPQVKAPQCAYVRICHHAVYHTLGWGSKELSRDAFEGLNHVPTCQTISWEIPHPTTVEARVSHSFSTEDLQSPQHKSHLFFGYCVFEDIVPPISFICILFRATPWLAAKPPLPRILLCFQVLCLTFYLRWHAAQIAVCDWRWFIATWGFSSPIWSNLQIDTPSQSTSLVQMKLLHLLQRRHQRAVKHFV